MSDQITVESIRAGIGKLAKKIESCADELNEIDGALGDGDLGVTMLRGVRGMIAESENLPSDVGMALMKCAQAFTRVSGSTYGPILATGLMSAAKATRGRDQVPWSELSELLAGAVEAMARRGRSALGDKTVLDAIDAAARASAGLSDPAKIAHAINSAVADALEQFRGKQAKQGRARIFGQKSIGMDDPGMLAFKRIVESFL